MKRKPTRFFIFGIQRSGTSLLVRLLDSHPEILCMGEVLDNKFTYCHPVYKIPRYRLYLMQSVARIILNIVTPKQVFTEYLDSIFNAYEHSKIGFKLMLNQEQRYHSMRSYLQQHSFKVVHVKRENLLKTYVSRLRAQKTGVWHATHAVEKKMLYLSPKKLLPDLDALAIETKALDDAILEMGLDAITVGYEDFAFNGKSELYRVLDFLDVDTSVALQAPLKKITPDNLSKVITNYDEVVDLLSRTGYAAYLC